MVRVGRDHLAALDGGQVGADDVVPAGQVDPGLAQQDAGPVRDLGLVLAGEEVGRAGLRIDAPEGGYEVPDKSRIGQVRYMPRSETKRLDQDEFEKVLMSYLQ